LRQNKKYLKALGRRFGSCKKHMNSNKKATFPKRKTRKIDRSPLLKQSAGGLECA
jgi:hypothetical protein